MKLYNSIFLVLILTSLQAQLPTAQPPNWINYEGRKQNFPDSRYLTGFSSQPIKKTDDPEAVKRSLVDNARTQLVESISVSISSAATLNIENYNTRTQEIFRQASTSTSQADLIGMKTDEYYDAKKKVVYAFVYLNKTEFLDALRAWLVSETNSLSKKIETAHQLSKAGDMEQALKSYGSCFADLRQIEGRIAIVLALGREGSDYKVDDLESQINKGISDLQKGQHSTLEELCYFIADGLKQQLSASDQKRTVRPLSFTYMDSRMGSDFAVRLLSALQSKLVIAGIAVTSTEKPMTEGENPLSLSGTYWPSGNSMKVIANLSDDRSGRILASAESFLPLSWLTDQKIPYLPDNYQSAIALAKELSKDEVAGEGLVVKLWTNKGNANPVFKKDEKMNVWVQVNQPCFVRLIYFLADGRRVLLLDSRYLDDEKVNKPYQLPQTFRCDAPYGGEILQMVAQTGQFKPLTIRNEDGYSFIEDSNEKIIATTRGMKKDNPALLIAEKRINITTLEK